MTVSAAAGSTITIKDPSGNTIGTGTTDATGKFDVPISPTQTSGTILSATATVAGNTSLARPVTVITAPTNLQASLSTVTGNAPAGSTVNGKERSRGNCRHGNSRCVRKVHDQPNQ